MATPESKVKKNVKKILDDFGCYHFSPATGGYGSSGVPDLIACYKGKFIGIECKAGKNQPTALQADNIARIRKCGGIAMVVREDNLDLLVTVLKEMG